MTGRMINTITQIWVGAWVVEEISMMNYLGSNELMSSMELTKVPRIILDISRNSSMTGPCKSLALTYKRTWRRSNSRIKCNGKQINDTELARSLLKNSLHQTAKQNYWAV